MFQGEKVNLRLLQLDDVNFIMENINDLSIRQTMGSVNPMSRESEIEWIKSGWEEMQKGRAYIFAITKKSGEMIGTVSLFDVSHMHQFAELGVAIYPKENHNQGYGTDAVKAMCAYGFLYLNLHLIYLYFFDYNKNGYRAYEKAGLSHLCVHREFLYRNGKYNDLCRMDITRKEWMEKFPDYTLLRTE